MSEQIVITKRGTPVKVFTNWEEDLPCAPKPLHTGRSGDPLLTVYLGENFHGRIMFDCYVALESEWDSNNWVLWIGDDGSQAQDSQPRLVAVACVSRSEIVADDEISEIADAAPILIYAWLQLDLEYFELSKPEDNGPQFEGSEDFSTSLAEEIADKVKRKQPLYPLKSVQD